MYFSKALFEGLIFGGACIQRGLSTEGDLHFKIYWVSLIVTVGRPFWLCFTLYLRTIFQVQALGGLIFGEAILRRFFCVTGLGGLYLEGLIFGILRYLNKGNQHQDSLPHTQTSRIITVFTSTSVKFYKDKKMENYIINLYFISNYLAWAIPMRH